MSGAVKGWCPGALRPMESGDGLVVRLRLSCGQAPLRALREIAAAALACGNGALDLSARAHLQIRGVREATLPALYERLAEWLDASPQAEAVRNVLVSPFAGLDPASPDVRPFARAWEADLANRPELWALPGKFGFAFDAGPLALGPAHADVAFEVCDEGWIARLADGPALGPFPDPGPVALALARAFLALETKARRMREALATQGLAPFAAATGLTACDAPARQPARPGDWLSAHLLPHMRERSRGDSRGGGGRAFAGFAAPFGRLAAADLARIADAVEKEGGAELRLTPWRGAIAPMPSRQAAQRLTQSLTALDLILDPQNPLLAVAACPGAPDCASAQGETRGLARALAQRLRPDPAGGIELHVSGCAKGCAHPAPAPLTIVAHPQGYARGRHARAGDVLEAAP